MLHKVNRRHSSAYGLSAVNRHYAKMTIQRSSVTCFPANKES